MAIKNIFKKNTIEESSLKSNDESEFKKITSSTNKAVSIGMWTFGIGLGGFLLWASLAPLDEGVPSQGMISVDTKSKTVQHLTGGLVKEVLVGEGDFVKEGQLLIRLDEAIVRANFESAKQRYVGLRAMQDRLVAEQSELKNIRFHSDVVQAANDPQIQEVVFTQEQLFNSRRLGLQSELKSIEESIRTQKGLAESFESMLANKKNQKTILAEELTETKILVQDGYVPRNRQLELERMNSESNSNISELQGNILRSKGAVAEMQQRMVGIKQAFRKEVESQLAEVGREVPGDAEKFNAAKDDLSRIEIKSPATGQVVGLAFQTVGGVIGAGQKLMDIVPKDQALLIEAHVAPHMIDRIKKDMKVDVRFSSFAHTPQLVVNGKVVTISNDVIVNQQTGISYYLARVGVTADGYKQLGNRQLQPGMPVDVVFLTGERSMLTYLLSPLTKRLAASMKEE